MRLVVDASVAVKWFVDEDDSALADAVVVSSDELYAPRLMVSELANALWRKARLGELEPGEAAAMLATQSELPIRWSADESVGPDALRLALVLDRPVYDCVYLALAHRIGGTVITADVRFVNALAATSHRHDVLALADYTGGDLLMEGR